TAASPSSTTPAVRAARFPGSSGTAHPSVRVDDHPGADRGVEPQFGEAGRVTFGLVRDVWVVDQVVPKGEVSDGVGHGGRPVVAPLAGVEQVGVPLDVDVLRSVTYQCWRERPLWPPQLGCDERVVWLGRAPVLRHAGCPPWSPRPAPLRPATLGDLASSPPRGAAIVGTASAGCHPILEIGCIRYLSFLDGARPWPVIPPRLRRPSPSRPSGPSRPSRCAPLSRRRSSSSSASSGSSARSGSAAGSWPASSAVRNPASMNASS